MGSRPRRLPTPGNTARSTPATPCPSPRIPAPSTLQSHTLQSATRGDPLDSRAHSLLDAPSRTLQSVTLQSAERGGRAGKECGEAKRHSGTAAQRHSGTAAQRHSSSGAERKRRRARRGPGRGSGRASPTKHSPVPDTSAASRATGTEPTGPGNREREWEVGRADFPLPRREGGAGGLGAVRCRRGRPRRHRTAVLEPVARPVPSGRATGDRGGTGPARGRSRRPPPRE